MPAPFDVPSIREIHARVEADLEASLQDEYDPEQMPLRGALVRVLAKVFAGAVHVLYLLLKNIAENFFPWSATGVILEHWAAIWGVYRKRPTFARGPVRMSGQNGALIADRTLLQRSDGVRYEVIGDVTVADGLADLTVEALRSGSGGNVEAGAPLALVSPVAGVDTEGPVTGTGISGGFDAEGDESLRERLISRIQNPPQGGSEADYVRWAKEVPGVTRAWAVPQGMGPNTVVVIIVTDDPSGKIDPPPGLTDTAAAYIRTVAPVTAEIFVVAPRSRPVRYRLAISPDSPGLRSTVEANLLAFHLTLGPGDVLQPSRVSEIVSTTPGEEFHNLLYPVGAIEPDAFTIAIFDGVEWESL